jgi:hypothetical protein
MKLLQNNMIYIVYKQNMQHPYFSKSSSLVLTEY